LAEKTQPAGIAFAQISEILAANAAKIALSQVI